MERSDGPSALCLSRQNPPRVAADVALAAGIRRGGYVLSDAADAQAVILATGSEVSLALQAQAQLAAEGIAARVVSMPCTARFERQPQSWRDDVLPRHLPAVAVEAAQPDLWHRYVGRDGAVIGIATFGESAPAKDLYRHFGITADVIAAAVRAVAAPPAHAVAGAGSELAAAQ